MSNSNNISDKFKQNVKDGNISYVRASLSNNLHSYNRLVVFAEELKYAGEKLSTEQLYETHDGEVFNENTSEWNKNYCLKLQTGLDINFSQERLYFLYKVVKYLYANKASENELPTKQTTKLKSPRIKLPIILVPVIAIALLIILLIVLL
jgi:hypothetical protein